MGNMNFDQADYNALKQSNIIPAVNVPGSRFDSDEEATVYFARELDYIKSKSYDKLYPELAATSLFPVTHEVPEGAETVTYYGYDKSGMASIISNYSQDLPRADVYGKAETAFIKSIGDSYGYSVQDMRASRQAGKRLDSRKAEAARYMSEKMVNQIAFKGDADNGLVGVLSTGNNIPLYTLSTVTVGGKTYTDFEHKTADEILADITGLYKYQARLTQNVEKADTLALPSSVFIELSQRRIPDTDTTVLSFIKDHAPYLKKIVDVGELESDRTDTNPYAATDGTGKGVMFMFTNSADKFSLEIPMAYKQYPIQAKNLEFVVPCEQRTAGIIIYYPMSALIAVGV